MSGYMTIPPDQVTDVSTVQKLLIGTVRQGQDGKRYVYFKAIKAVLQGDVVYQADLATYNLYEGWTDQSADCGLVAGVAMASVALNSYGWAQVAGYNANVREDAAVALKDALIGDSAVDGEATGDSTSTNEELVFAMAASATTTFVDDNGTTLDCCEAVLFHCLWG